ncbi:MAG: site-specific integrase [Clostridiaceae bacterium]|nr:site-specific integrase [Clostridiaceae bacterium]
MKMPAAKKLPSGQWRIQVMVDGKRLSITDEKEKSCVAKAAAIKAGLQQARKRSMLTVGAAIDLYIDSKDSILSPATVAGYKRIRKNCLQELMNILISALKQEQIQRAVNNMAKTKSSKSVRNAHGLLSAVLFEYAPDFRLSTTLPQKTRPNIAIPDDKEIGLIMQGAQGTKYELPILLALWLGLRASEIRGITWDSVQGEYLHINQAIVEGENGPEEKGTKTLSGDRFIKAPKYILDLIAAQPKKAGNDHIIRMSGQAMYKGFSRLCEKIGLPHYRFHDLRHASASVALALGVPDKYSMQRMGHATDNMLKTVYQHTMLSKTDEFADRINMFYDSKLHTKLHTENDKSQ